jgi:hypothetical protein
LRSEETRESPMAPSKSDSAPAHMSSRRRRGYRQDVLGDMGGCEESGEQAAITPIAMVVE